MRRPSLAALLVVGFALASCAGEEVTAPTIASDATGAATSEIDGEAGDDEAQDAAPDTAAPDDGGNDPQDGQGSASLSLANGEEFTFSVLCTLEPQMAAGSEILFTATSYDDPGLDITQFGDEGIVTDLASVGIYDGDFEMLWSASSIYEGFGGTLEMSLDGSTISGSGSFYPNDDITADPVDGTFVANC